MAWWCTQWGALPEAGGLLDQPAGLLRKMSAVKNAYDTIASRRKTNNLIAWIDADPQRYEYYLHIRELLNGDRKTTDNT